MEADLKEWERLGGLFFRQSEIEIMMNQNPNTPELAIKQGRFRAMIEIRETIIEQATQGSDAAQKMIEKWIKEIAIEEATT